MSRINVLRKGSLSLIIGGLAVAITLSGCDSPVGSATETTAPRDGVMRVLPDRFALDMPGALLPQADSEAQSVSVRTSSGDPARIDSGVFGILEGEHNNALLNSVFWFVIADEILSSPGAGIGRENEKFVFTFGEDLALRMDKMYEEMPLFKRMVEIESLRPPGRKQFEGSVWASYRNEDESIYGESFIATYTYSRVTDSDFYDYSSFMQFAFEDYPEEIAAEISVFWSDDLKRSAVFGNSCADDDDVTPSSNGDDDDDDDGEGTDNITFFAFDEEKGESFFLFVEFENDDSRTLNFEEANFREHPTLSNGAFFLGKQGKDGDVIRGVADDDGGSLQVGTGSKQYFDSNRLITSEKTDYIFEASNFEGMDAVAMLLSSGIEIRPEFKNRLTNSSD